jgi:hypothetical protein
MTAFRFGQISGKLGPQIVNLKKEEQVKAKAIKRFLNENSWAENLFSEGDNEEGRVFKKIVSGKLNIYAKKIGSSELDEQPIPKANKPKEVLLIISGRENAIEIRLERNSEYRFVPREFSVKKIN